MNPGNLEWILQFPIWILEFQYGYWYTDEILSFQFGFLNSSVDPGVTVQILDFSCGFWNSSVDPGIQINVHTDILVYGEDSGIQWEWLNGNPRIPVRILGFQWQYVGILCVILKCVQMLWSRVMC